LYVRIARGMGDAYRAKDAASLKKVTGGPMKRLESLLAAAVKAGKVSKAQAGDTLKRLRECVDALGKKPGPPPEKG